MFGWGIVGEREKKERERVWQMHASPAVLLQLCPAEIRWLRTHGNSDAYDTRAEALRVEWSLGRGDAVVGRALLAVPGRVLLQRHR